jgi:hypothetical protein
MNSFNHMIKFLKYAIGQKPISNLNTVALLRTISQNLLINVADFEHGDSNAKFI